MENKSWRRNHGGEVIMERPRRRNNGGGIMEDKSWKITCGSSIMEQHILDEKPLRTNMGASWKNGNGAEIMDIHHEG